MTVHIALLRGINLGATRRVPMAELRTRMTDAGYEDVRTLLQSGNVVMGAPGRPDAVGARLEGELAEWFGFEVPVVVRSATQLAKVVERDPLGEVADDPKKYVVTFLSGKPDASYVRELSSADHGPERFSASGRELYAWLPNGFHNSKLARACTSDRLGVTATVRNWATVTKLLELARA